MIDTEVTNVNRSLGTIFGSEITKKYDDTLDEDTFIIKCSGAGGQSFGAFIPKGLTLNSWEIPTIILKGTFRRKADRLSTGRSKLQKG